jgi:hypothetical protein
MLLLVGVHASCGGSDSPTAPTPTQVTPIVVSVTAQIADSTQGLAVRGLTSGETLENRNVRVTGMVSVTGGDATVEARVMFSPDGTLQQSPMELVAVTARTITPTVVGGTPFSVDIPFSILSAETVGGTVRVEVSGTDERGGLVNVSTDLPVIPDDTLKPAGTCIEDDQTLCVGGDGRFEWTAEWLDPDGTRGPGVVTFRDPDQSTGIFTFVGASAGGVSPGGDLQVSQFSACGSAENVFAAFIAWIPNVAFTLTVTDTQSNQTREFDQRPDEGGTMSVETFATCP